MPDADRIERAFVRIAEGLVHYRHAGADRQDRPSLYMVHAGPGSSAGLASLISALGETRRVVAPDTLGNGDSAPPGRTQPDLAYYADSIVRVMDALRLEQVDYFGTHTGAHIGVELLLRHPQRVRRAIFDGIGIFPEELKRDMLANYAPEMAPDDFGLHLIWAWQFARDQMVHFPYFKRDPEHRLPKTSMLPSDLLHGWVLEVLKGLTTYHNGYRAVFKHDTEDRLGLIKNVALLLMAVEPDPLTLYLDAAAALVPHAQKALIKAGEGYAARIKTIVDFYDAP
jgi:pimeloyl-ACP methyl ester carboxylesterase